MTGVLEVRSEEGQPCFYLEGRPLSEGAPLELQLPTGDWLSGEVHLIHGPQPRPGFRFHRGVGCDLGPRTVTMALSPGWTARWGSPVTAPENGATH